MPRALTLIFALAACGHAADSSEPPVGACDLAPGDSPALEVSHYGTYDALGDVVYCGIPPQGGAPYAPFGVRIRGMTPEDNGGMHVVITATDATTQEVVGESEFWERFLCSNVGESEGYWVAAEFHLRFYGRTLEDLHGREVDIAFTAEGPDDTVTETLRFDLDCVAGTASTGA